jgi:predicted DNA-binding transcriptional regulator AlpA
MWKEGPRWCGRLAEDPEAGTVSATSRGACLARLRDVAGPDAVLTVEVTPELVGVAEAAAILGWDKRRIFTYLSRGSFPDPVVALASGRVWRRDDIEAYARTWRRRTVRDGPRQEAQGSPVPGAPQ